MASTTNYLGLKLISNQSTQWYSDMTYNFSRIDAIGKQLRLQSGDGTSAALRVSLLDGTLVDAIKVAPGSGANKDKVTIYLGRSGAGDTIVINASSSFASLQLSNKNPAYLNYIATLTMGWLKTDPSGDDVQNVAITIDPQNNAETTVSVVPAYSTGMTANAWLGSASQLELDATGNGTNRHYVKFQVKTSSGALRTFVVPAYEVT